MMRSFTYVLLLALLVLVLVCAASVALGDTTVHGITIRTADEAGLPQLRICTTVRTNHWSNPGSSDATVMFCPTSSPDGVRPISFPQAQAAAALLEEQVLFTHDSFEMSEDAMAAIRTVSAFMAETPTATLTVAGHADASGTEEYNMGLSQRRAEMARDFFLANGTDADQIKVVWFGETQLAVDTLVREPANRRVEFVLSE